jgi:hypothetical protein
LIPGPDLPRVAAAFNDARARYVVIGGFAVIAHQYVRATEDVDLLIPDDEANDRLVVVALERLGARQRNGSVVDAGLVGAREHLRIETDAGLVDLLRAGAPPLDFDSVDAEAIEATVDEVLIRVCGLASLVAFKRLAGRSRDRLDLEELRERHGGELPLLELPGLDDEPV